MPLTITEALAEIKTIGKRIEKKQASVLTYLARHEQTKDPLSKEDGGSVGFIARENQAIADLESRIVALRVGILAVNSVTPITAGGVTKTITEWLVWRRDITPRRKSMLANLQNNIQQLRKQAQSKGAAVIASPAEGSNPMDIIVNINEHDLAKEIEALEETLGTLDGQLSLKNATVIVEV